MCVTKLAEARSWNLIPVIIVRLSYIGRILPEIAFWIEDNCARVFSV